MKISQTGIIISVLPSLFALALIGSLAVHIHLIGWQLSDIPLGYWPPSLDAHFSIWSAYFFPLLFLSISMVPIATIVCLIVPRLRHITLYLALHTLMLVATIYLSDFLPDSFTKWLWD
ncbi:MAG: hypothetical protein Q3M24_03685 [Candidatus Electrothrix aestuarii]|uniref:Uncharacterized protein n=1 Tax=Candidatus Electrothrix aestuarii TaxID=3062594 RepID=A0AAU8LX68_9BACT|nr:hypothetical protein [Candidatus Electrothrix aestuarii]